MRTRLVIAAGLVGAWVLSFSGSVEAKITLDPDFTGTVMITTEEGKVLMLDPGNTIPEIPSNSTLEVFQGSMKVHTEEGDNAGVGCLGSTGAVSGAGSVSVECGDKEGKIKALKGSISFDDADGKKLTVGEGQEKNVTLSDSKQAPATAAGEETGTTTNLGIPPVDSRSIETSPSQ